MNPKSIKPMYLTGIFMLTYLFLHMFQVLLCDDCWCMLYLGWTRALATLKFQR
ncbi:hypothetical protein HanRHA438_Chr05g0221861 [Helianthus annuus]|nr:hypothetical protein HanRHA438_Chr05g0221861 [Helianthus annuus]